MPNRPAHGSLRAALIFAITAHGAQRRKDGRTPYVVHPISVFRHLSSDLAIAQVEVLVAGLLHDVLEDTSTSAQVIEQHFGPEVLALVQELTIPAHLHGPSVPDSAKTRRILADAASMSPPALVIKLCDRWDNLSDMGNTVWSAAKKRRYVAQTRGLLRVVERRIRAGELPPAWMRPAKVAARAIRKGWL